MARIAGTASARSRFRPHTLDDAMLYFHPTTGTHVRVANVATRGLRRAAPRVAMFGITNACNLACEFCSRDTTRDSLWTARSAAAVLRGLSDAGTLEVAFGGGEPFAFRGFPELLAELHETTPLALHVTTNGTLLRAPLWRRVHGMLGQVRVSIYPDTPWRDAADLLAGAQQLWGANLLVDNALVDRLPALLAELAERGCHDVSLLSYVGPDDRRHLDRAGEQRLARIIDESPMPCRISVCFGARVPLPRLFAGIDNTGDCGAGYDFVSITPDQRVQSCSFQDHGMPAATAEDVLAAWRMQQVRLAQPSPRQGCARALPLSSFAAPLPPVAVWQAFSGNNSGECILVAKFETVDAAEKFLSELVPGWRSDAAYSPEWQSLFTEEGVTAKASSPSRVSPEELDRIGRSVIALAYDAGDAFPELRALAWKRGAFVTPGGVHVHEPTVLAAVRAHDRDDARELAATYLHEAARTYQHGDRVLVTMPFGTDGRSGSLTELKELLASYAGHRPVGVEFFGDEVSEADFLRVKQRLGDELAARPRLFAGFYSVGDVAETHAAAHRLAAALDEERARVVANGVLIDPIVRRKRAAVLAYRHDAYVQPLDGLVLKVSGSLWFTQERRSKASPRLVDRDALSVALASTVSPSQVTVSPQPDWMHALTVTIETDDPSHALAALGVEAERLGCNLRVWVDEVDPLAWAVRRLLA